MNTNNKNRIDYRKVEKIPEYPITFLTNQRYIEPITFIEERIVNIEGIAKNYYIANNIGQLFNIHGHLIKPYLINSGYYVYSLYTGHGKTSTEKYKHILSHRLFKFVFDPIPNFDDYTVDHIDMNRNNNALYNLEYVTQAENNRRKELNISNSGSSNYHAKFNRSQLIYIIKALDQGIPYNIILSNLNIEVNKNNKDYIGNIKRGITYKNEVAQIRKELYN